MARLHRELTEHCDGCHDLRVEFEWKVQEAVAYAILSAVFLVLAGILFTLAGSTGWFGFFFGALAFVAIYFALWAAASAGFASAEADRLRQLLEECERGLERMRTRFAEAVRLATTACCPRCEGVSLAVPC